jgi:hypothetical protein
MLNQSTLDKLAELNEAILELIHKLNQRPFRKLAGSRAELYQNLDRPELQPLPLAPFVYAEWKKARVNLDYPIELGGHYYSTPYQLVGKEVEARSTSGTVEIFYQGKRVASHVRSSKLHVASTNAAHRPKSHQSELEGPYMRLDPVPQVLRPGSLSIGVVAGAQHCDEHHRRANLAGLRVRHRHRLTRMIHEHLLPGVVLMPQHHVQAMLPLTVTFAVPTVGIALGVRLLVLLPQQLKGDILPALQFLMDRRPVRQRAIIRGCDRRRWKQPPLQCNIVQIGRQRPTQTRRTQTDKIPLDGAFAHLSDRRYLSRAELRFKMEAEDFACFTHR